jgi:hypothetical protein
MKKSAANWQKKSFETLENHHWGDLETAKTNLVKRCMELSKVSVGNFTVSDLRVMIGQKLGLQYLIPLAIEKLQDNIFVDSELYAGDLLESVLRIDTLFWDDNKSCWKQLNDLIKENRQEIKKMGISTMNFDNSKF